MKNSFLILTILGFLPFTDVHSSVPSVASFQANGNGALGFCSFYVSPYPSGPEKRIYPPNTLSVPLTPNNQYTIRIVFGDTTCLEAQGKPLGTNVTYVLNCFDANNCNIQPL